MTNHDTALVIALWAIAAITYGLVLLHDRWHATSAVIDTELTDTHEVAEVETYRAATPADVRDVLADPEVPPIFKAIVAQAAHDAGLCGCGQPYDQDGELTDADIDWLSSQDGRAS